MKDYKLVYIAGGGHSGSTLLDLIMGASNNAFGMGEVCFYNSYRYELDDPKLYDVNSYICSCGKDFNNCSFWNQVSREAGKNLNISRRNTIFQSLKTVWNIVCTVDFFRFELQNPDDKTFLDSVFMANSINRPKFLIDSSKDPRRLLALENLLGKDKIKVIFLVRDIRGYVNSYSNPNKWRVKDAGLKPQNFLRAAIRWVTVNVFLLIYLKIHRMDYIKISYDRFSQEPDEQLSRIRNKWGLNIPLDYLDAVKENKYHNIHGNLMRFSNIEKIKWDRSWNKELPGWKKNILNFLFGWINRKIVFSK